MTTFCVSHDFISYHYFLPNKTFLLIVQVNSSNTGFVGIILVLKLTLPLKYFFLLFCIAYFWPHLFAICNSQIYIFTFLLFLASTGVLL